MRRNMILGGAMLAAALLWAQAPSFAEPAPATDASGAEIHKSGSWTVRCPRGGACQMIQAYVDQNTHAPVAGIVINYVAKSNVYFAHFIVPLGVIFKQGLTLTFGTFQAPHLNFKRCERDGCYVEGVLPQSMIDAMQSGGDSKGSMEVAFINGKQIRLPVALDGFGDGVAFLKKASSGEPAGKR